MQELPQRKPRPELVLAGLEFMRDSLRRALGDDWPAFEQKLTDAIERVVGTTGNARTTALAQLIDLGLSSPAANIFRTILRHSVSSETEQEFIDALRTESTHRKSAKPPAPAPRSGRGVRGPARSAKRAAPPPPPPPPVVGRVDADDSDDFARAIEVPAMPAPSPAPGPRAANGGTTGTHESVPPPRVVNVGFTDTDSKAVSKSTPLVAGRAYRLRVDIGKLSSGSVIDNPTPVRSEFLPPTTIDGWWLKVVVVSRDFDLAAHRWLFLHTSGDAWACSCKPHAKHTCEQNTRLDHVAFDLNASPEPGKTSARVTLFFNCAVVQSILVAADVEASTQKPGSIHGKVDYNLTNQLTDLAAFEPRQLGIMMNRSDDDGSHTITFDGATDAPLTIRLSDLQLRDANDTMRSRLRTIHIEETGAAPDDRKNRFDNENRKDLDAFVADLRTLADSGYTLWTTLLGNQLTTWLNNRKRFLEGSGVIHVARKELSTAVFPWALIYDLPIEMGAPHRNRLCDLLTPDNWKAFCATSGAAPTRCPHEATHRKNVICPFGFWGFRYQIELPPSVEVGRTLSRSIRSQPVPLNFVIALSDELNVQLLDAHLKDLRKILTTDRFTLRECHSRDEIRDGLGLDELPFVYFYCHGQTASLAGSTGTIPTLRVGNKEEMRPTDLVTWRLQEWADTHWQSVSPLVFINGCHTVDTSPQTLVNFVDSFSGSLLAAGVIGTEITLHQSVANEAAFTFIDGFEDGLSAGQALHRARTALLKKGNLLGLAYTAYCAAELRLQ